MKNQYIKVAVMVLAMVGASMNLAGCGRNKEPARTSEVAKQEVQEAPPSKLIWEPLDADGKMFHPQIWMFSYEGKHYIYTSTTHGVFIIEHHSP